MNKIISSKKQMSDSFGLGALLILAGGFLDAYTYLSRDGVFANAQTGNIVLLGLNLFKGRPAACIRYLIPILAFTAGVLITEFIKYRLQKSRFLHWRQIIIAVEILLSITVAFMPQGWNTAANVTISFLCALQFDAFRKINQISCATTMCTGNLRSGTELLFQSVVQKDRLLFKHGLKYYAINLIFVAGAVLGAFFTSLFQEKAVLVCSSLFSIIFLLMFAAPERKEAV